MRHRYSPLVVALLVGSGCTYGQVTWGGDPVQSAEVAMSNCFAESWFAAPTDASGWYKLDGYADPDDAVTEGLLLIMTTLPNGAYKFDMVWQDYEPCPDDPNKSCDRHDIDMGFKPLSGWEWRYWYDWLEQQNSYATGDFFGWCNELYGVQADPSAAPRSRPNARPTPFAVAQEATMTRATFEPRLGDAEPLPDRPYAHQNARPAMSTR